MRYNVTAQRVDGSYMHAQDVEFNFDADKKIVYLYSDRGAIFLNFNNLAQVGYSPVELDEL